MWAVTEALAKRLQRCNYLNHEQTDRTMQRAWTGPDGLRIAKLAPKWRRRFFPKIASKS